jgi:hypothetical protein
MAWKYNPFTDALDNVGSGGGTSYIDGDVEYHSNLPVTVGSPAVNSAFLVRKGEGLYFISRKPAGIWVRELNNGNLDDWKYAGTFSDLYRDANFRILNNADVSKELAFDLANITTGTTRTLTAPNASGRIQVEGQPIGNTTPAAGTFTTLAASSTVSGTGFSNYLLSPPNIGITTPAEINATVIRSSGGFQAGTIGSFNILYGGNMRLGSDQVISWNSIAANPSGSFADTILARDAANVLALRNAANASAFNIYNTHTSSTNHERGLLKWSSNVFQIGTEKGSGGGTARALALQTDGTTRVTIGSAGGCSFAAGSATVPSISFDGSAVGIYQRGAGELTLTDGSEPQVRYFSNFILLNSDFVLGWGSSNSAPTGGDTLLRRDAAGILAQQNGANAQAFRLYNTSSSGNANFERLNIRWASNECIIDAEAGGTGTSLRGIKIGSATSSLLGFYGATPVDRPATVADPAGGGTVDTEARTAINDIIDRLQELGLIA